MEIKTLDGDSPSFFENWADFLKTCSKINEVNGVIHYRNCNCNYILFPDGTLVQNFAFWGDFLMKQVESRGANEVLTEVKNSWEIRRL